MHPWYMNKRDRRKKMGRRIHQTAAESNQARIRKKMLARIRKKMLARQVRGKVSPVGGSNV